MPLLYSTARSHVLKIQRILKNENLEEHDESRNETDRLFPLTSRKLFE
jgi:hypothetical protein